MADNVQVKFGAQTSDLTGELSGLGGDFKKLFESIENEVRTMSGVVQREMKEVTQSIQRVEQSGMGIGKAFSGIKGQVAGLVAGIGIAELTRKTVETVTEFERLRAVLTTLEGDAANTRFEELKKFATETPYDLQQVVTAFTKLKAQGLDPGAEAMRSYGNIAAAMGKSLDQITEAATDAAVGEFERLKEFGIKASQQGDKVTFMFKGQSTTVKRSSEEIQKYLRSIGDTDFAGAMDRQMKTLGGAISNLQDSVASFADDIGKGGLSDALNQMATEMASAAGDGENLATMIGEGLGTAILAVWDIVQGFGEIVSSVFSGLSSIIGEFTNVTEVSGGRQVTVWQTVRGMINGFSTMVRAMATTVGGLIRGLADTFVSFGRVVGNVLSFDFKGALGNIKDWATGVKKTVQDTQNGITTTFQQGKKRQDAILAPPKAAGPKVELPVYKPTGGGVMGAGNKGGGGGDSKVQQWRDELQSRIEAEVGFFKDSTKLEIDFWNSKLKLVGAKSKEAMQIRRQLFQLEKSQAKEALDIELETLDEKQDAAKDDQATQMRLQDEKMAVIARSYGEDSQQYRNALREKNRMARDFARENIEIERDRIDRIADIAQIGADTQNEIARIQLDERKAMVQDMADVGGIDPRERLVALGQALDEELALEVDHERKIFEIKAQSIRDQIALYSELAPERRKLLADLEVLEANHASRMDQMRAAQQAKIKQHNRDVAKETRQMWIDSLQPVGNAFNGILQGMIQQTDSFRNLFIGAMDQLFSQFVNNAINMGVQWLATQLGMTAATQAQNTTRMASDAAAATTSAATASAAGLTQITTNAAVGASGAFAATAPIPFVGPALAPGVAAAAMAAILGFGALLSAEGGMDIPSGQNPLTQLHEEEMVLPKHLANPLRAMLAGAGPRQSNVADMARTAGANAASTSKSQSNSFSYAPSISSNEPNLEAMLSRDGAAMRRWFKRQVRNGNIKVPD